MPAQLFQLRRGGLHSLAAVVSIHLRDRPAKQVWELTLVEPTFIEQGSRLDNWLGVQRPPVRNA